MGCDGRARRRLISPMWRAGRLDAFWEFNLNPWDTSAGYLLVEEAGGTVTHFDGGRFTLDSVETLASNGLIADEMQRLFADMFAGAQHQPDSDAGGVPGRCVRPNRRHEDAQTPHSSGAAV